MTYFIPWTLTANCVSYNTVKRQGEDLEPDGGEWTGKVDRTRKKVNKPDNFPRQRYLATASHSHPHPGSSHLKGKSTSASLSGHSSASEGRAKG